MARSFFHLTPPRPGPGEDNPLVALTTAEFEACCAAAQPLLQGLVETINAYSETHPDLSLMACYIAVDMVREMLKAALRDTEADA